MRQRKNWAEMGLQVALGKTLVFNLCAPNSCRESVFRSGSERVLHNPGLQCRPVGLIQHCHLPPFFYFT
jgi:hypothetical protein